MKLAEFTQLEFECVDPSSLDVFVAACGYEHRAPFVASRFLKQPRERLALAFSEHPNLRRRRDNARLFEAMGYDSIECSGDDYQLASSAVLDRLGNGARRLGIDISSMTRAWFWGLTRAIAEATRNTPLEVFYFYAVARFVRPGQPSPPPTVLGPIPGLGNSLELPDRGISLLVGLGYEADRALGLVEYIDPRTTWLFYTDPAPDLRFTEYVKTANRALLERVGEDHVVKYQYDALGHTIMALDSLLSGLVRDSRVVIAPLGPKPFGLISFLLSLKHPGVDVWRVSPGARARPQVRQPAGKILVARTLFIPS